MRAVLLWQFFSLFFLLSLLLFLSFTCGRGQCIQQHNVRITAWRENCTQTHCTGTCDCVYSAFASRHRYWLGRHFLQQQQRPQFTIPLFVFKLGPTKLCSCVWHARPATSSISSICTILEFHAFSTFYRPTLSLLLSSSSCIRHTNYKILLKSVIHDHIYLIDFQFIQPSNTRIWMISFIIIF